MTVWGALGVLITILLTLATLIQGLDSAVNLVDRWRSGRGKSNLEDSDRKPVWKLPGIRVRPTQKKVTLTQRRVSFLSGAMVIWLLLLVQIYPLYQYFSRLAMFERVVWVVAYCTVLALVPFMIGKADLRLVFAIFLFPTLEMGLAMVVLFNPAFAESEWYPTFFGVYHLVCSFGFRISLLVYFVLYVYDPWYRSLPKE